MIRCWSTTLLRSVSARLMIRQFRSLHSYHGSLAVCFGTLGTTFATHMAMRSASAARSASGFAHHAWSFCSIKRYSEVKRQHDHIWLASVPLSRPAVLRCARPGTAAPYPISARLRSRWIRDRTTRVFPPPVCAPFKDVAMHVIQPPCVRWKACNRHSRGKSGASRDSYHFCLPFFGVDGRPMRAGRSRRWSLASSLATKRSPASGRPLNVWLRMR